MANKYTFRVDDEPYFELTPEQAHDRAARKAARSTSSVRLQGWNEMLSRWDDLGSYVCHDGIVYHIDTRGDLKTILLV